ncbi:MAG: class A beta-lactamase-related serine hydrolase [Reyranella sp.]|uniref:serine hydrolase domain-containing protein n=1 Tax=Reyranella sp. TaxID=1929291 RepID=UPI0012149FC4|nr:serine hydrolase domain-containing protein [Reyranella sp.]TAJ97079.1 MAG: class A beta-lactamase-related serine hydrolase [Reyranella sp.]TBR30092.1 MAG: class A beta-lactamase-related serine hydrolase [Reyranella sp.]
MSNPAYPANIFAEIDAASAAFAEQERIPGVALGIVQEGRLVHTVTTGLADREGGRPVEAGTAFRIASMTKNMTALAILSLRDRGWLQLDAPLAHYVPQFGAVKPATRDSALVTVRHLLTHTAGFVTDDPWGDRVLGMSPAELDRVIATGHLFARPPGLAFEYSNLGYALLGRVLTNVSGEPYQGYMRRTFLEPLGMAHTTFDAPAAAARGGYAWGYRLDVDQDGGETWSRERIEPDGEVGAMGGLATTVLDYASYVSFLLGAWPARDEPESGPVRRSSVREMVLWHAPPFVPETPPGARSGQPSAYGYGLTHSTDALLGMRVHHAGGLPGYGSHVLMLPERGWGVFAFGNRTYAPMSRLTLDVAERLHAASPPLPLAPPSPALARAVDAIVVAYASGRIEGGDRPFAVNFLLDVPAALRDAELASLKRRLGEGRLERIEPIHALAGRFVVACAKGRLNGTVTLSPEADSGIQKLVLTAAEA